ncbi:MAG: exosortase system-associated protein, TIGR04073 family [Candidatus Omnitrophota bacterium]|nr:exosortase system-associated protein, TIGR04073 family [Candidatus Omnitrophota bacterium]
MAKRAVLRGVLAALLLVTSGAQASAESTEAAKAFKKLTRGFVNIVTGWVELPKRIQQTSEESGALSGFTWGLLRGLGYGFARTAAGLYELVTFPFPAPPDYEPVIQPEYVFTTSDRETSPPHP